MTQARPSLDTLPGWPRLLNTNQAAAYMGMGPETFRQLVGSVCPEPVKLHKKRLFDRAELDKCVDLLSRKEETSPKAEILRGLNRVREAQAR